MLGRKTARACKVPRCALSRTCWLNQQCLLVSVIGDCCPSQSTSVLWSVYACHAEADWSAEVVDWCQQHLPSPNKPTHAAPRADSCSADLGAGLDLLQQSELGAAAISRQQLVEDFLTRMEAEQHPLQGFLPPASELFKCLRVRMAIATGIAEKVKQHKVTRMIEYFGQVVQKVQAMVETPEGGQVRS